MKYFFSLIAFSLLMTTSLVTSTAFAADMTSAVGDWLTIDDKTGKPKSVVRISQIQNELRGNVIKILDPAKQNDVCKKCKGANKDKPVMGMTFMWGLKKTGNSWAGGAILDPENGKVYKAKMALLENGKKLNVRGFIGFSLIGRTQTWIRQ